MNIKGSGGFKTSKNENAFYTLELHDDGSEERSNDEPELLKRYTIDRAQFCHMPLKNVFIEETLSFVKLFEYVLARVPHKTINTIREAMFGQEPIEMYRGLPSPHHRYIRFRTEQKYGSRGATVWGIFERLAFPPRVVCSLYESEEYSIRETARITKTGVLPFRHLLDTKVPSTNVEALFNGIGGCWNGDYNAADNNCIHYALECWKRLEGSANWNQVCDGHSTILNNKNDPGGRKWYTSLIGESYSQSRILFLLNIAEFVKKKLCK